MDEYIEREAALSAQNKSMNLSECRKRLKRIPAADVRPVVKARWNVGADGWECSNCTIESNNTYPICPYCGAEMMEES